MTRELDVMLRAAVDERAFPGCVGLVWRDGAQRYLGAHGHLANHPAAAALATPVGPETIYDLASLTKVLSTTTLVARAVGRGQLSLEDRLPESLALACAERPTLRDLLEHASGLAAHREFFAAPWSLGPSQPDALIAAIRAVPLEAPARSRAIYSDLGFMLLGAWLEQIDPDQRSLDRQFAREVAEPLGVADQIGFCPLASPPVFDRARVAPTEVYEPSPSEHWHPIRARLGQPFAHAIVHDDNCVVAGGVAGHAGLFGTAFGVLAIARAWLERRLPGIEGADAQARVWAEFCAGPQREEPPESTRRLGWDGPSPDARGSTGAALSSAAFGHLGFTGTSVWIDPSRAAIYILLSNRVHPSRHDARIRTLRQQFHGLAASL